MSSEQNNKTLRGDNLRERITGFGSVGGVGGPSTPQTNNIKNKIEPPQEEVSEQTDAVTATLTAISATFSRSGLGFTTNGVEDAKRGNDQPSNGAPHREGQETGKDIPAATSVGDAATSVGEYFTGLWGAVSNTLAPAPESPKSNIMKHNSPSDNSDNMQPAQLQLGVPWSEVQASKKNDGGKSHSQASVEDQKKQESDVGRTSSSSEKKATRVSKTASSPTSTRPTPAQMARAERVVDEICEVKGLTTVPSKKELELFCSYLGPGGTRGKELILDESDTCDPGATVDKIKVSIPALSRCVCTRLSFFNGDDDWCPRFRLLHALKAAHETPPDGRTLFLSVMREAEPVVEGLALLEQTREVAAEVLQLKRSSGHRSSKNPSVSPTNRSTDLLGADFPVSERPRVVVSDTNGASAVDNKNAMHLSDFLNVEGSCPTALTQQEEQQRPPNEKSKQTVVTSLLDDIAAGASPGHHDKSTSSSAVPLLSSSSLLDELSLTTVQGQKSINTQSPSSGDAPPRKISVKLPPATIESDKSRKSSTEPLKTRTQKIADAAARRSQRSSDSPTTPGADLDDLFVNGSAPRQPKIDFSPTNRVDMISNAGSAVITTTNATSAASASVSSTLGVNCAGIPAPSTDLLDTNKPSEDRFAALKPDAMMDKTDSPTSADPDPDAFDFVTDLMKK
ncbi:unnamed protein product [Amoebophrya sp. A25]|nr:unnamed protein product [Amoebophrya sp. A25]|eukprot:GSA25T00018478001.1